MNEGLDIDIAKFHTNHERRIWYQGSELKLMDDDALFRAFVMMVIWSYGECVRLSLYQHFKLGTGAAMCGTPLEHSKVSICVAYKELERREMDMKPVVSILDGANMGGIMDSYHAGLTV